MQRISVLGEQTHPIVTHQVTNQPPSLLDGGFNAYLSNRRLREGVAAFARNPSSSIDAHLTAYGRLTGSKEMQTKSRLANENPPVFTPFDRYGNRVDQATFHPSYHELMRAAIEQGRVPTLLHDNGGGGSNGEAEEDAVGMVPRSALGLMHFQVDGGTSCPLCMKFAALPALKKHAAASPNPQRFEEWIAKARAATYDERDVAMEEKQGIVLGMSMTEKQGGSDVRQNTTVAVPSSLPGAAQDEYLLTGHKWFTSAPMSDAFLTLAYTSKDDSTSALSCFLVPRWLGPGRRNTGLRFQRLKPKLGDRSNASSEVEYHGAVGYLLGEKGHGVRTIIEMVEHTRLDCLVGSAGLMQMALFHAANHCNHRAAFGAKLIDKPLMRNVLCDLALECEGATALAMRVAQSFDDPNQRGYQRLATAIGKYYNCKRCPAVVVECLECLGGNGFVEEFPLAALYRQAPLNAVWEGSGNVIVLDVFRGLRAAAKGKKGGENEHSHNDFGVGLAPLAEEVASVGRPALTAAFQSVVADLSSRAGDNAEVYGRIFVERFAVILSAAALFKCGGPPEIAVWYEETRVSRRQKEANAGIGAFFGTLSDVKPELASLLLARHIPTQ